MVLFFLAAISLISVLSIYNLKELIFYNSKEFLFGLLMILVVGITIFSGIDSYSNIIKEERYRYYHIIRRERSKN